MRATIVIAAAALAATLALPACNAHETPVESRAVGATNLQPAGEQSVAARITVARCLREDTCGHIGAGHTYGSRAACENALDEPTRTEVRACTKFDAVELDRCTHEIRTMRCADPLETVGRIDACRVGILCK